MTLQELQDILAQEGDFTLLETDVGVQITLRDYGAKLVKTLPWEELAWGDKTLAIAISIFMHDQLYRLS